MNGRSGVHQGVIRQDGELRQCDDTTHLLQHINNTALWEHHQFGSKGDDIAMKQQADIITLTFENNIVTWIA
jgi:hypothetical protein